jgi:hypothetical protein
VPINKSSYTNSPGSYFLFIFLLSTLFISAPEFIYFIIKEQAYGQLWWGEALMILCVSLLGALIFAGILWLLLEPMRKKRQLKK